MEPLASSLRTVFRLRIGCLLLAIAGLAGCANEKPIQYRIESRYPVSDPQFARTMGSLFGTPLVHGNASTTLLNGKQIFPAMLDAIRSAKTSINFETFIYWSGTIGKDFSDALSERAEAGVPVHMLLDWVGSGKIDRQYVDRMKRAGVQIYEYHPLHLLDPASWRELDHRTHRKILVIDGKVGFTGGVGIADVWRGNADRPDHWRDNHYRLAGPVVAQLQAVFMDNWIQTTGQVLAGDKYFPPLTDAGPEVAQVCRSSSKGGSENMQMMFLMSVAAAAKSIRVESAYFVPDDQTRRALVEARRRGVRVQIIVPGPKIDAKIVRRASRATWGELLKAGVEIYEFQPTMFHCKQLIIDEEWVSIGSSNLDNRSFRLNDEANINVLDGPFAAEQVRVFEDDRSKSRPISYEQWKHRPLSEKISNALASLFEWEM